MSAEPFVSLLARCQRHEMWGLRNQAHNHDVRIRIAPNSELWRLKMNRTVVSGIAAFALIIGAGLAMTDTTAEAGRCGGGLFSRLHAKSCGGKVLGNLCHKSCGGGLLARLKAKHASNCCAPEAAPCETAAPCATPCETAPCATETECCEDSCCKRPCLLQRLFSKHRRNKSCCESSCATEAPCGTVVEEAASSSDSGEEAAPPAPVADAKTDA